jgi:hypothetical protein
VNGLGVAKCCEIIAAFELASRFPLPERGERMESAEVIAESYGRYSVRGSQVVYFVLDGAKRSLDEGIADISSRHDSPLFIRRIMTSIVHYRAAGVIAVINDHDDPAYMLYSLDLLKRLRIASSALESVTSHFYVSNDGILSPLLL